MSAGLCVVQAVVCVVVEQKCFGCIDGRVQLRAGVQVLSVQVHTPGISPAKKRVTITKTFKITSIKCIVDSGTAEVLPCISPMK